MVNFNGDVPQKVNHCTAFNDRYYVFLTFSVNKSNYCIFQLPVNVIFNVE